MRRSRSGFTLAELLVSIAVLAIIVVLTSKMINSVAGAITLGSRRLDVESQVRPVLDRIGYDLSQMVRRSDVDYHVKSSLNTELGNDQIAFFASTPGYYPSPGTPSSLSLVSYRINSDSNSLSYNRMERMGKGLLWSGVSSIPGLIFGLQAIYNNWPNATSVSAADPDYELVAPQIFRFEYFYILNTGAASVQPGATGMRDIAAISVVVAAIDQKSRLLLSEEQIDPLIAKLVDFSSGMKGSELTTRWQSALNAATGMPRPALNGIRIYQRYFVTQP
jgi:prepilin-type N-terminal cleavage/methylation domain-containing protein